MKISAGASMRPDGVGDLRVCLVEADAAYATLALGDLLHAAPLGDRYAEEVVVPANAAREIDVLAIGAPRGPASGDSPNHR